MLYPFKAINKLYNLTCWDSAKFEQVVTCQSAGRRRLCLLCLSYMDFKNALTLNFVSSCKKAKKIIKSKNSCKVMI